MKAMKKITSLLIVLLMLLSMAACGGNNGGTVNNLSLIHISEPTRPY